MGGEGVMSGLPVGRYTIGFASNNVPSPGDLDHALDIAARDACRAVAM